MCHPLLCSFAQKWASSWPFLGLSAPKPDTMPLLCPREQQQGFQLAMTRALGHRLLAEYGVIPDPSGALNLRGTLRA